MAIEQIINKTLFINASPAKVWDALTNPELIKQWLFGTNVISDWNEGSPIYFTGEWQGTEYKDKGTILQFEKEKVFQYNYWSGFSGLPDSIEYYSIITFTLEPTSKGTQLNLTQSNFPTETGYEHSDKNWDTVLEVMKTVIEK